MEKTKTKQAILNRINKLNRKIDLLIINGKDYTKEAIEHANLYQYAKCNF